MPYENAVDCLYVLLLLTTASSGYLDSSSIILQIFVVVPYWYADSFCQEAPREVKGCTRIIMMSPLAHLVY